MLSKAAVRVIFGRPESGLFPWAQFSNPRSQGEVAEPGGVHRGGKDRPAARVADGIRVAAQQPGDAGQVLGDPPPRAGRGRGLGQDRVAAPGRRGQLAGGEPGLHVHEPAAVIRADRVQGIQRQFVEPAQHPPGSPGRVRRAPPGADRGDTGVPLPGPDGRHGQVARLVVQQEVKEAQRSRAVVRVHVPAKLAQPQNGPGRDTRLQPRGQCRSGPRVFQRPLGQLPGDRFPGGPGRAGARLAAYHHQPAGLHRRRHDQPQALIMRPADVRGQRAAAGHRVHAQLGRRPLPDQTSVQSHGPIVRPDCQAGTGFARPGQIRPGRGRACFPRPRFPGRAFLGRRKEHLRPT